MDMLASGATIPLKSVPAAAWSMEVFEQPAVVSLVLHCSIMLPPHETSISPIGGTSPPSARSRSVSCWPK